MSDDEFEHAARVCKNPDTRLILYRLGKLEKIVEEHVKANQMAHSSLWKSIRSLQNSRTYACGAFAIISGLLWWFHKG